MADLTSYFNTEQNAHRVSRGTRFVVHVELRDFRGTGIVGFEELDADDMEHAGNIACAWVNNLGATSAAVRRVFPKGDLSKVIRYYNTGDTMAA